MLRRPPFPNSQSPTAPSSSRFVISRFVLSRSNRRARMAAPAALGFRTVRSRSTAGDVGRGSGAILGRLACADDPAGDTRTGADFIRDAITRRGLETSKRAREIVHRVGNVHLSTVATRVQRATTTAWAVSDAKTQRGHKYGRTKQRNSTPAAQRNRCNREVSPSPDSCSRQRGEMCDCDCDN